MDPLTSLKQFLAALRASAPKAIPRRKSVSKSGRAAAITAWACCAFSAAPAAAAPAPALVIEATSGAVLYEDHATQPWYPASLTKLMTVYVALKAVRDRRIAFDTPLAVSTRAAAMPPSKMGFRPGTLVTLGNALKLLMVKSANDTAVTIAEGLSGSVEAFADEMNAAAASLGMAQSHFVNPNGLPNPQHVSSARDFAILARTLYLAFPEQADLFSIGALRLGGNIITNHNNLLGRYPGVDGMKTGFTCAAGFNVVASATQGGRKLIAVVLGAPNVAQRTIKAAALFDRGFAGIDRPGGPVTALPAQGVAAPDMRAAVCQKRGKAIAAFNAENERLIAPLEAAGSQAFAAQERSSAYDANALAKPAPMATRIGLVPRPSFDPVPISVGAPEGYAGPIAQARPAHTPVGTEPPPGWASAYAAANPPSVAEGSPLAPDVTALPLKRRNRNAQGAAKPAHKRHHAAPHRAAAHAEPKIIDDAGDAAATPKKTKAVKARPAKKKATAKSAKPAADERPHAKAAAKKPHGEAKAAPHRKAAAGTSTAKGGE
jgi:D-alanyl-D-alanine carboxypeptidase